MPPLADVDDSRRQPLAGSVPPAGSPPLAALSAALHERAVVEPALEAWAEAVPGFLAVRMDVRVRLTRPDGHVVQVRTDERRDDGGALPGPGDEAPDAAAGRLVEDGCLLDDGWLLDDGYGRPAALASDEHPSGAVLGGPVVGGGAVLVMLLSRSPVDWHHGLGTTARCLVDELRTVVGLAVGLEQAVASVQDADAVLRSRAVIDQAVGVVMAHHCCGAGQAMERLRRASQRTGVPVARLAERLVTDVSGGPPASPDGFRLRPSATA
ncbi:ANTAR domain-containing protein [Cellulomonas sp. SG140]|uniref:ANTAR domain-containing protein n=1 Tax=Cellulomonas sp. SG140 TaxID=2976536 RepID=UPI0021E88AE2|nr:ANTAR domain-containing protein [Cellulomonas sp. SG140]